MSIHHTPCESSNVASYGYDAASQTLEVAYKSGGTYRYHGITEAQHAHLHNAESKGQWVHKHLVQAKHPHTKV